MTIARPENWDFFTRISINVKRQLIDSPAITTKQNQLGLSDAEMSDLLDSLIADWVESYRREPLEYKGLIGWILCDSVKRRFLTIYK